MRIALGLEYDGGAFCGWQTQPGGCGVQDAVERALGQFADVPIGVVAAGRTDTGVHASAQVIHFDAPVARDPYSWVRGTNRYLAPGVRVLWCAPVADDFHARYGARSRTYRYLLLDAPVPPAILRGKVGWYHVALDVARMQEGLGALLGTHDFSAFRDAECQARSPVREMKDARIERRAGLVSFSFRANAFLHHMIRNIVGSLVYVGAGKHAPSWIGELLEGRDRRRAAPTFAPDGLYLAAVEYDQSLALPRFPRNPLLDP